MEPQPPKMIMIPYAIYVEIIKRIEHLETTFDSIKEFQTDAFLNLHTRLEKMEAPVAPSSTAAEEPPRKKAKRESSAGLESSVTLASPASSKWSVWNEAKRLALKELDEEGVTVEERGPMRKGTMWYRKTKILHELMMMKKMEVEKASPAEKSGSD